ncbi:MAG: histidine kinase, partial [Hyphomicrobiaceae bacterium]|nr:histidine kinase [Hyphomicrobiaceae bacterium]
KGGPGQIEVTVEDDGPGLSEMQRKKLGKRGLRLDESKPGSGLGLSIVTDFVQMYRGELALDASTHGGLRAVLRLPGA